MSQDTADIVGTIGSHFDVTLDSGEILHAVLSVVNQATITLAVSGDGLAVTVPSLPAGDSLVRLDLIWAPGDGNATIDVGTVTIGSAQSAPSKGFIRAGQTPGFVELFGT